MDFSTILRLSEFFKELSEPSLKTLAGICIPKEIDKKGILFSEGAEGYAVYLLICGTVQLYKTSHAGRETVIKVIEPGEIFGEVILFEQKRYPVSARSLVKSTVLLMPRIQIHCLLQNEAFRNDFMRMIMAKQRYLTERIQYLTVFDLEERFYRFISSQYGEKDEYTLPISKKDLAASIGALPETLSRLLTRLEKEGKLTVDGNRIRMEEHFWDKREPDR
ncbi:MAG: Crp/Fnr family transcriptional regulator [Spirochaetes bacterium]|nr:Crp/Fnr family transcriptional regulator [Spirochaetota bacterium]